MRKHFAVVVIALTLGVLRVHGQAPMSAADREFFERKVRPLLVERCHSCHSAAAKKKRGGLHLDSRASILQGGDSGPALTPGDPEKSLLIRAVRYHDANLHMPPKGKLPEREIAVLVEWVQRGAPFAEASSAGAAAARVDLEEGRKFWSFQPLRVSAPPPVKNESWPRRRIDSFLLAAMEQRGLSPSPPTSAQVLVRRLYFDLLGLPPTPVEVEAFVKDESPQAFEKLVERLLASPHYGERWARSWLDLARYCDVGEPWGESKGKPYLYRDWVVQALNADMPYDRFVKMQLAADLLPDARPADRAALGFLGLAPQYWKELKLDKDVIRTVVAEEWEERIHTLTSTFLGLTVACARCHDHKFDPITMEDYYGLAGVFASTRLADRPLLADAEAAPVLKARQQVQELEKHLSKLKASKQPDDLKKIEELKNEIDEIKKRTPHFDLPLAAAVAEASLYVLPDGPHRTKLEYKPGVAQDVAVQIRGNPANQGPVVPRRFLAVFTRESPKPFTKGSGRLELAQALVHEAAPLTARVLVNRVWKLHFGTGLVETPSDFGAQGERPSHPELLDDLAARFVQNGWSLKWLHREIVLSAAYRQASVADAKKQAIDPDNRFRWRMNRRRLDVEAWRDAMLAATGTLDKSVGGPPLDLGDPKNTRRTLYGLVKRRELHDLLRLHDFPDPTIHSASRVPTTTPLQQLFTLNSPFLEQQAAALVKRLKHDVKQATPAEMIQHGYRLLFARPASTDEVRLGLEFLGTTPSDVLWQQYAQVLLGSNEFLFID